VSGWGAGYPGVPADAVEKAKAEAAAKAAEPKDEDSEAEAAEDQGA
jgi:hypothetical protein